MNQLEFIKLAAPANTGSCGYCGNLNNDLILCCDEFWLCPSCVRRRQKELDIYANRRNVEMFIEYMELIRIGKVAKDFIQLFKK